MSRSYRSHFRLGGFRDFSHRHASIVGREDTFSSIKELDAKPQRQSKTTIRPKAVPPDPWEDISIGRGNMDICRRVYFLAWKLANTCDSVDEIAKILIKRFPKAPLKECLEAAEESIEHWNEVQWQRSPEEESRRGERRRLREERRKLAKEHAKLSAQHKEPELPKDYEVDLRESKRRFRKKTGCAWVAKE